MYEKNNQNEGTRNNKFNRKPVTNVIKYFSNFADGYTEMCSLVPDIKVYGGDTAMFDAVIDHILNLIRENTPSIENSNYPNTLSFSINAHEVGLRTDSNVAFGWNTLFDKFKGVVRYKFRVTFTNSSTIDKSVIKKMIEENQWEEIDTSERHTRSRFWRGIEYGMDKTGRRPFNRYYDKKQIADAVEENAIVYSDQEEKEEVNVDIASQFENYVSPDNIEGPNEVEVEQHEAEPDPVQASTEEVVNTEQ